MPIAPFALVAAKSMTLGLGPMRNTDCHRLLPVMSSILIKG